MALTATVDAAGPGIAGTRPVFSMNPRPVKILTGTVAFDASYPTGGELATAISDNFKEVLGVVLETDGTRLYRYDKTNNKILAYSALGTQVANTTDLSAVTAVRFLAWGY